ncbi:SprT-like domain-containing protein [Luteolibacter pohnpeiensis]|uniref:SprT-like domain-containing protein n=2 Tax=Luteolibacter pohnpeiensis TaxID=454153 RepID=A0A934S455_9BACT|nr:SprT-like domain-containing protein [Luteolibacter pohnpeiensis]
MGRKKEPSILTWPSIFKKRRRNRPVIRPNAQDHALTAWCDEAAKSLGLRDLGERVVVAWNGRMQTTAGRAWWPDRYIELNPKLKDCPPEELWRTLKHELAHLVAYERAGRRRIDPHGGEWQQACADLGIAGEQPFHNLPFKRRRMKRNHAYICPNCLVTLHRVRPIQRAVACYSCCKKYNKGNYHERFRLMERRM